MGNLFEDNMTRIKAELMNMGVEASPVKYRAFWIHPELGDGDHVVFQSGIIAGIRDTGGIEIENFRSIHPDLLVNILPESVGLPLQRNLDRLEQQYDVDLEALNRNLRRDVEKLVEGVLPL